MDPDVTLTHLLRLRAAIDAALEGAVPVSDDDVYALVGLFDELDRWMREGRRAPSRWARSLRAVVARGEPAGRAVFSLDVSVAPSNDNSARRRRPRVRDRSAAGGQLALPWLAV